MTADDDDRTVIRPMGNPGAGLTGFGGMAPPPVAARPAAPTDNDRTLMPGEGQVLPATSDMGNGLPVGTMLGEFELTSLLGEGGFGIVYLANDHSLERRVALKEYMPSVLAARTGPTTVQVRSERHRETFEAGRKSFINEARCWPSSTTRRWSRSTGSGRPMARPTWPCPAWWATTCVWRWPGWGGCPPRARCVPG